VARSDIICVYPRRVSVAAISLKLSDDLLEASGHCADALQLTRAEYMRRALEQMNRETRARLRARRLRDASGKVRGESMRVNAEFEAVERDLDA
jgi:predicted transcriptional regulator